MGTGTESARLTLPWQQAALLVGITLAVFSPTLSAGFVYDARLQMLTDPFLHDPRNWWPVLTFGTLSMDVLDFNRPVNLASLMLDAAMWGKEPFGYHLTSVLLHAVNVVLVWKVLGSSGVPPGLRADEVDSLHRDRVASLLGPLLFAVHPVVTEAVCEPSFREDLLVAFFTLAGLLLAMGHQPDPRRSDCWRAAACVACSLLAIGSKESGVAAPVVIGIYWLVFRRGEQGWFWPVVIGGAKLAVVAFLAARFLLEPTPSKIFESRPQYPGGSLAAAMLIEPRILALYVQLVAIPVNLCADYGLHSVLHLPLPVALAVVAAVIMAAALAIRADRRMALATGLVMVPLLPVANLVPIYRAAADRYLYLPMAGVGLAAGLVLTAPWLVGRDRWRVRLLAATAAVVVLLAAACTERQKVWASPIALWADTFQKNPMAFTAASGLADALRQSGRLAEAEEAARRAIALTDGTRGDAWATLALILDDQRRSDEAFAALDKALELDPKLADPAARVAVMAMEQPYADDLTALQARRKARR
ncbi:MAG: tetratricopeptide repeat protein [Planctomycetia bacterium]